MKEIDSIVERTMDFFEQVPSTAQKSLMWNKFKEIVDKKLAEQEELSKANADGLKKLNEKYKGKFLYFNGDENGCQWLYVDEIFIRYGNFHFKGVMIEWDCQGDALQIYNCPSLYIDNCMYFSYNFGGSVPKTCEELDAALMRQPIDTNRENHIMTAEEVAEDVMNVMGGMVSSVSGPLVAMPDLARFFFDAADKIKEDYENEVQDC